MSQVNEATRNASRAHDLAREEDQFFRENRELKGRIRRLQGDYAQLEQRIQRIESSIVFRFLRWLGNQLIRLHLPLPGTAGLPRNENAAAAADESYRLWAQETALSRSFSDDFRPGSPEFAAIAGQRVTILLDARQPDISRMKRMLQSLVQQEHTNWELFICTSDPPPPSIVECVPVYAPGRNVEIIPSENPREAIKTALDRCRSEFAAWLDTDAILGPNALHDWLCAMEPGTSAVYSDWDHIDSASQVHSPCFTPELSPALLRRRMYWGLCYLVRAQVLRAMDWPSDTSGRTLAHDLALRLADSFPDIRRVPRVLWHVQDGVAEPATDIGASHIPEVRNAARVSVIVCSRNPSQLARFFQSLSPAVDPRHEFIIVAHQQSGRGSDLAEIAAKNGAIAVPYDGPFHFGIMNELGVASSTGSVLCLLNDDVYPTMSGWLERMVAQAVHCDVGVVGALLLYPNGVIQHAGVAVGGWHHPAHIGRGRVDSPYWPWLRTTREVTAVTGACMVLRRSVWDELGGFDVRFPVNYNDVDLCLRAGERGYRVLLEAEAILIHDESRTRIPTVRFEEADLLHARWSHVIGAPDKFFNPQFGTEDDSIQLPPPWTLVR